MHASAEEASSRKVGLGVVARIARPASRLGHVIQEICRMPTVAMPHDALSVEDLPSSSGGAQGSKNALCVVEQDAR